MSTKLPQKWPAKFPDRLQYYGLPTPNGQKISVALEELELPYEAHRVDISAGEQFLPEYVAISPNSKIPGLIDPHGPGGEPLAIMESGAILIYLAEKSGRLLPREPLEHMQCLQWLFFQVGHIGPMFGQFGHFYKYAKAACEHPYPQERYAKEAKRLLQVLETQLQKNPFVAGQSYSIADIAIYPWVDCLDVFYGASELLGLLSYPKVQAWLKACKDRPAHARGAKVCE